MSNVRYRRGETSERPWGRWEVLDTGPGFAVKRITVKPGATLSLQVHHYRSEHWIIVKGTALVTLGKDTFDLGANQSAFIPVETQHRIENPGGDNLEFIEIQYGECLDENDIVRIKDNYGRA